MRNGKIVLTIIGILTVLGVIVALKTDAKSNRKLYYLSANGQCLPFAGLTTTGAVATTYFTLPIGAVAGWFTDPDCRVSPTLKATVISD